MSTDKYFDNFVPDVRKLCDPIYTQHCEGISRRNEYHSRGITLIENMIPEFDDTSIEPATLLEEEHDPDLEQFLSNISAGDFSDMTTRPYSPLTALPYGITLDTDTLCNLEDPINVATMSSTSAEATEFAVSSPPSVFQPHQLATPTSTPPQQPSQDAQQQPPDDGPKIEANACCEICGYRPKGSPQWFKGSMAKHKKLQHSKAPPKIYRCPYPGCTSAYKNRPDNLRQHQFEKKHFIDGEVEPTRKKRKRTSGEDDE